MKYESGRTLVEVLGALAMMGVLSIVGLAVYQYSLRTAKANDVINDARVIHTLMLSHQDPQSGSWVEDMDTATTTPYRFSKMYDKALKPFIMVSGIEKGICKRIIQMSSDKVSFLTSENTPFTTCGDENKIVVNFNIDEKMTTCTKQSDCTGTNEICSAGQCITCPAGTGTDQEQFQGNPLTDEYEGCYCKNPNESWLPQEK